MGNSFLAGIFSDRGLGRVRRLLLFLLSAGKGAQGKALGHRIVPRAAKGLAPCHTAQGQQAPPDGAKAPIRRDEREIGKEMGENRHLGGIRGEMHFW